MTVNELSESLIQAVSAPMDEAAGVALSLASRHVGSEVDAAVLQPFQDLVEKKSLESKEILS
jgi:hypothetical protein